MSELTLFLLRFGFLAVLWAFIFGVVYALRTDLFGRRVRKLPAETPAQASAPYVASAMATPAAAPAAAELATPWPLASPSAETEAFSIPGKAKESPAQSTSATRLVITSGPKEGMELPLSKEPLTIGRSSESGLVIRDDYTSTHHARLMLWSDSWVIQDLDSTNGTFLDGSRVTLPTPVPLNTPVRIGATSFELRR